MDELLFNFSYKSNNYKYICIFHPDFGEILKIFICLMLIGRRSFRAMFCLLFQNIESSFDVGLQGAAQ